MILKASLPSAHFSSVLLLKEQMIISVKKSEKCSSFISSKFALNIPMKLVVFYRLFFSKVCPKNSPEISQFFCEFALKIPRNLVFSRDLLEALVICFCGPDGAQHSITFLSFWSY